MLVRFDYPRHFDNTIENLFATDVMPNRCADFAIDIFEQDKDMIVSAELPGVKKEDVKITFEKNVLTISGERKLTELLENVRVLLNESRCNSFSRSIKFGYEIDSTKISAEMSNGVLTITLPKTDAVKAREITIQ